MPSRMLEASLLVQQSGEQPTKAAANEEEEEEEVTDRNGLIFSFLAIILSIPALIGA